MTTKRVEFTTAEHAALLTIAALDTRDDPLEVRIVHAAATILTARALLQRGARLDHGDSFGVVTLAPDGSLVVETNAARASIVSTARSSRES